MAVEAGADAVGVILARSKRQVTIEEAADILCAVPPGVRKVGVFVDAEPAFVALAVEKAGLDRVQFHGMETPAACAAAPVPVVKALRVGPDFDPAIVEQYRGVVAGLLLDTLVKGEAGGSGVTFDWSAALEVPRVAPVWLAGGLTPDNVAQAVRLVRPAGVDVSSGVEAVPRRKDPDRIRAFIAAVRAADEERDR
jgi:phosphoribosylanthranilate isomerase